VKPGRSDEQGKEADHHTGVPVVDKQNIMTAESLGSPKQTNPRQGKITFLHLDFLSETRRNGD
jgi:hypothetical protein